MMLFFDFVSFMLLEAILMTLFGVNALVLKLISSKHKKHRFEEKIVDVLPICDYWIRVTILTSLSMGIALFIIQSIWLRIYDSFPLIFNYGFPIFVVFAYLWMNWRSYA